MEYNRQIQEIVRSIVGMQVCHQVINTGEPLTFPSLQLGNGLAGGCIGHFYLERQTVLSKAAIVTQ